MRRDGALTYDVAFPGGGVAPLGERARSELGRWIDRVTLVDQTLRAYGVPRVREGEEACLRGYDGGLIPSERERFGAVVAGNDYTQASLGNFTLNNLVSTRSITFR